LSFNAVAGGRFTEGIEVKDGERSLIKYIIIAGVPYPNPNDAVFQDMAKASGISEQALMREIGRIRTLQAIGRGVRGLKDNVTVWLLDERFAGPRGLAVKWGIIKHASGH
jgi:Rad3-related DNA helicases